MPTNRLILCEGGVEPSYRESAELVYQYFGENLKILFCIRNPISVLYSVAKNQALYCDTREQMLTYLKKYNGFTPELFDEWSKRFAQIGLFSHNVSQYIKFFSKENVKCIISEEMFANPRIVLGDVQKFLGLNDQESMVYDIFPHENIGNKMPIDYRMACINAAVYQKFFDEKNLFTKIKIGMIMDEIFSYTTIPYHFNMLQKTRDYLIEYYREDIYRLENLLGRPLPYTIEGRPIWH